MNDIQIINEIEKEFRISIRHISREEVKTYKQKNRLYFITDKNDNIIDLSLPFLFELPVSKIIELQSLKTLCIGPVNISDLSFLEKLPNLTALDLSSNNISDLSPLAWLPLLTYCYFDENSINSPPESISKQGIREIQSYFHQTDLGVEHLYEARVLFVGEPGAGKTSLMQRHLSKKPQRL